MKLELIYFHTYASLYVCLCFNVSSACIVSTQSRKDTLFLRVILKYLVSIGLIRRHFLASDNICHFFLLRDCFLNNIHVDILFVFKFAVLFYRVIHFIFAHVTLLIYVFVTNMVWIFCTFWIKKIFLIFLNFWIFYV